MTDEMVENVLNGLGFQVAVNEHGRWIAERGPRKVFGDSAIEILTTIRSDYRPGKKVA